LRVWSWPLRWQVMALGVALVGWLGGKFLAGRRAWLLPGVTSDGHHVIETACGACHSGFARPSNDTCTRCHRAELADDTHPTATFDDPRWAAELARLDARRCISCHTEHRRSERGVTASPELCFGCHDDVVSKRANHRGFAPGSCLDGGCHNYHDNRTLSAAFMSKRLGHPATFARVQRLDWHRAATQPSAAPAPTAAGGARGGSESTALIRERWRGSAHARQNVDCARCHGEAEQFVARPDERACAPCHSFEVASFRRGKHGARGTVGLPALRGAEARQPMRRDAEHAGLGCGTCHDAHGLDTRYAAVRACLSCHADQHSRAYLDSPHAAVSVTCATCHLPRLEVSERAGGTRVAVHHDNNFTLQPRDRMARQVCLQCHSLELAFASLFDEQVVRSNFLRAPQRPHPAIEMLRTAANRDTP
jgi:predicted CXXCH cytochrome family protein